MDSGGGRDEKEDRAGSEKAGSVSALGKDVVVVGCRVRGEGFLSPASAKGRVGVDVEKGDGRLWAAADMALD